MSKDEKRHSFLHQSVWNKLVGVVIFSSTQIGNRAS